MKIWKQNSRWKVEKDITQILRLLKFYVQSNWIQSITIYSTYDLRMSGLKWMGWNLACHVMHERVHKGTDPTRFELNFSCWQMIFLIYDTQSSVEYELKSLRPLNQRLELFGWHIYGLNLTCYLLPIMIGIFYVGFIQ